jgi:PAS domain S-box-containing protein
MNSNPVVADHRARILVVDDERHNRRLLEVMLEPEGFLVRSAASGEEALAMIAQEPPDLVLLDVMMPRMDGYQVASTIKGDVATKNIPVIMVTSLDGQDARMLGLEAGVEEFLTKPVDRAELCARVKNLSHLKAYAEDKFGHMLAGEVESRTAELVTRTTTLETEAIVLTEQAALLDLAQDAIVLRDMEHRIVFWSRGAEVMYGWLGSEAVGRNAHELLRTEHSASIDAALLEHDQWEADAVHHKRDGSRMIVASRWALQRDMVGTPLRILTISNDLTGRKPTPVC